MHGAFDPMQVAVARQLYVASDAADKQAALARLAAYNRRLLAVSRAPDGKAGSHVLAYAGSPGETERNALVGTPDEICRGLEALNKAGAKYVLLTILGGKEQLRSSPARSCRRFQLPGQKPCRRPSGEQRDPDLCHTTARCRSRNIT